jgi:hypothetical protein
VSLDGLYVERHRLEEGVECDVADVFVVVEQEAAQDVDGENAKARLGLQDEVQQIKARSHNNSVSSTLSKQLTQIGHESFTNQL